MRRSTRRGQSVRLPKPLAKTWSASIDKSAIALLPILAVHVQLSIHRHYTH